MKKLEVIFCAICRKEVTERFELHVKIQRQNMRMRIPVWSDSYPFTLSNICEGCQRMMMGYITFGYQELKKNYGPRVADDDGSVIKR